MPELRVFREVGRRDNASFYHIGDGFHYEFQNDSISTIYFVCHHNSCGGRAKFRLGEGFSHTQPHNHPPDRQYPQIQSIRRDIMNHAAQVSHLTFGEILNFERRRIADRALRSVLTLRRLRPAMQRSRQTIFPMVPHTLFELVTTLEDPAWASISETLDLEDNIYFGSTLSADGAVSVLFMSKRYLEVFRTADILFADGTFYIAPSIERCYQVIPLFWCLMETKSECAYTSVLTLIRTRLGAWSFRKVITDYEDAIINAFRNVFGVEVQGCFFHSSKAMATYARETIGQQVIRNSEEILRVVRFCCSLALLPTHLIQRGLESILLASLDLNDAAIFGAVYPFLNYVQNEWVNHANRGRCMSVCQSDHRTNNASESNNRRMKREIRSSHPNIFLFIRHLVYFEDSTIDDLWSLNRGEVPARHRPIRSVYADVSIRRITEQLMANNNPSYEDLLRFLAAAENSVERIVNEALDNQN